MTVTAGVADYVEEQALAMAVVIDPNARKGVRRIPAVPIQRPMMPGSGGVMGPRMPAPSAVSTPVVKPYTPMRIVPANVPKEGVKTRLPLRSIGGKRMKENEPEEVVLESSTQSDGRKFGVIPCKAGLPLAAKVQGKAVVMVRSNEVITQYVEIAYDTPWSLLRSLLEATGGSLVQIDTKGIKRVIMVSPEKVVMSGYKMHHNMDLRGTYAIT